MITVYEIIEGTTDLDAITNDPTSKRLFETFKTSKPEIKIMVTKEKIMNR